MGVSPKFNFSLLAMSHFDWPATKKLKLWRLPKTKFLLEERVPSLQPTYRAEKRTTLGKAYGIKLRCHWEHFEEHIGNFLRTQGVSPPPQPMLPKRKNLGLLGACCITPLAEQNLYFYICMSPFST
jgi:hypothetical protein